MAIFGTTDESKFSVYLLFRIEEIADRMIERIIDEERSKKFETEEFLNRISEIENDEVFKARADYLIAENKVGPIQAEQIHKMMAEEQTSNKNTRPTLGVVRKDGTIEPISIDEVSPEYKTVILLIRRIFREGYGREAATQLISNRAKIGYQDLFPEPKPKPKKMPFENLFSEVPDKTKKPVKGTKPPQVTEMRSLSETELETLANKARKFVERQKAKRKKPTR